MALVGCAVWALSIGLAAPAHAATGARAVVEQLQGANEAVQQAEVALVEAAERLVDARQQLDTRTAELAAERDALAVRAANLRRAGDRLVSASQQARRTAQDLRVASARATRATEVLDGHTHDLRQVIVGLYKSGGDAGQLDAVVDAATGSRSLTDFVVGLEQLGISAENKQDVVDTVTELRVSRTVEHDDAVTLLHHDMALEDDARRARDGARARLAQQRDRVAQADRRRDEAARTLRRRDADYAAGQQVLTDRRNDVAVLGALYVWQAGWIGDAGLAWPVNGRPGSGYGMRTHPVLGGKRLHAGVDIAAPTGQEIAAAADGVVTTAGSSGGYGLAVVIDHGDGMSTLYGHSSRLLVSPGQWVRQGDAIALVGSTGMSTGPHLHFEVRRYGSPTNPLDWF